MIAIHFYDIPYVIGNLFWRKGGGVSDENEKAVGKYFFALEALFFVVVPLKTFKPGFFFEKLVGQRKVKNIPDPSPPPSIRYATILILHKIEWV